jgi:hypothetical protein
MCAVDDVLRSEEFTGHLWLFGVCLHGAGAGMRPGGVDRSTASPRPPRPRHLTNHAANSGPSCHAGDPRKGPPEVFDGQGLHQIYFDGLASSLGQRGRHGRLSCMLLF